MTSQSGYHSWRFRAEAPDRHIVFPDGCRDVLLIRGPDDGSDGGGRRRRSAPRIRLTAFDLRPRPVVFAAGTEILGYRLRPGAALSPRLLAAIAAHPERAGSILAEEGGAWGERDDAIMALTAPGATVRSVARTLGVSARTIERHFIAEGLPSPEYWRLLARARRAARRLAAPGALAEIAIECGFSDQAHMTRDCVRWFGIPPARLRRDAVSLALLAQPALGNWTGEQISTR
ncbi:MAG: helix-turn-helix domain-containing protein [Rhodobacteraceae bacterium]|nr:helix-turn-helix domain-containing protein [Paracoccaceae bacterium]